jgi:hypothetical protein
VMSSMAAHARQFELIGTTMGSPADMAGLL